MVFTKLNFTIAASFVQFFKVYMVFTKLNFAISASFVIRTILIKVFQKNSVKETFIQKFVGFDHFFFNSWINFL